MRSSKNEGRPGAWFGVIGAAALACLSCARQYQTVPVPFTAQQLAEWPVGKGEVLMTYLLQKNASVSVCDVHTSGPHVVLQTKEDLDDVVEGLDRGAGVDPGRWRQCVDLVIASLPRETATELFTQMGQAYRALLRDEHLDADPTKIARLDALQQIYLHRPPGYAAEPGAMAKLTRSLRDAIRDKKLSAIGSKYGQELLDTLENEGGQYQGAPVSPAVLDAIAARRDERLLERLSLRLPDAALREQALRRLIHLRVESSPFPEVARDAANVERVVLAKGVNAVAIDAHPATGATLKPGLSGIRVAIGQDVSRQIGQLFSEAPGAAPTNMADQDLRGALSISLAGFSRPVSLCGPASSYDPSPCVPASQVELQNPFVVLEQNGVLRFRENVTARDVYAIGAANERFMIPIVVGGRLVLTVAWNLRFLRPRDLDLAPDEHGAQGPTLLVEADNAIPSRMLYTVNVPGGSRRLLAVVELADVPGFHVLASGGAGEPGREGAPGANGSPGSNGTDASCPGSPGSSGGNGGSGGRGGDGTDGGPGGHGGKVLVTLRCDAARCQDLTRAVAEGVRAPGGRGGEGGAAGAGGRGGPGGRGGASASCTRSDGTTYSVSGGSSGVSGSDGPSGAPGRRGADGAPGEVLFRTIARPSR
jgi:hypothetical protein